MDPTQLSSQDVIALALAHWTFVVATLMFAIFGEVAKRVVTKEMADVSKVAFWFRKTLPLHATLMGFMLGLVNVLPEAPGVVSMGAKALYYAMAGIASGWAYEALRHFASKQKIPLPEIVIPDEITVEKSNEKS